MKDENLKEQAQKIIEQLTLIKEEFIKAKDELAVSVRKDIIVAELRSLLEIHTDYDSLSNALKVYIENLISLR